MITVSLLRLSISFHLRKYCKTAEQRWYLLALSLFTTAWNAGYFATVLMKCKPIEYFWTGWLGAKGSCGNASESAYAAYGFAGLGGLTDGVLILITIWVMCGRESNEILKVGLKVLMGSSCLAAVSCFARIPTTSFLLTSSDFFLDCVPLAVCSILELAIGILCLSAASFHSLLPYLDIDLNPLPIAPLLSEKSRLTLKLGAYRDLATMSGIHVSPKRSVLRKISERSIEEQAEL